MYLYFKIFLSKIKFHWFSNKSGTTNEKESTVGVTVVSKQTLFHRNLNKNGLCDHK